MGDNLDYFKNETNLSEFNNLSLEERAKLALRTYAFSNVKVKNDGCSLLDLEPYLEAWAYLEENKYVILVGGTPKSGASYKITPEGREFID